MNIHQTAMLHQMAREDCPQYASKLIKRTQRWKLYTTEEITTEVLMPLVRAGLVTHIVVNKCNKFQITQLGIDVVDGGNQAEPPEIVQPRTRPFVAWDGWQRWDTASERGCHRGDRQCWGGVLSNAGAKPREASASNNLLNKK